MTASFVLGSSKSSTYPEGTPPVSIRLRPYWTAILRILRNKVRPVRLVSIAEQARQAEG
jgi:hypothetical protein